MAKPGREIYEIAAARAGAATQQCLFVDDRLENVEAAITLAMTGVHYREDCRPSGGAGLPVRRLRSLTLLRC
ncbi:HAD-IA family hydrolase [Streptomyces sp. NPDC001739]